MLSDECDWIYVILSVLLFILATLFESLMKENDVWGAAGCHPKSVEAYDDATEHGLKQMLRHKKIVALGEIGLDYSDTK